MSGLCRTAACIAGLAVSTVSHAQEPAGAAGPAASTDASPAAAVPAGLEEIVVTAQRRSERLQNVPVAVTAASAARLAAVGITSTQELSVVTPGLTAPQVAGYAQPHIRGVGSSSNGPGIEPPVATYIDGVYIAAAPASLLTLNNIDRIEVLKGPQGTLFGRNATGGLIQVVTRDPKPDLTGAFNLSYANYRDVTADAYVSGPLADILKADLAVRYETQQKGWGRNLGTGNPVGDLPHDFAGRTKLLLEPSSRTQVRLAVDYEDRDSRREAQKIDERQIPATFNNPFFGGPFPQGGKYDVNNDIDQLYRLKAGGASLQIKQDVGSVILQSTTAVRKTRFDFFLDLDQQPLNLVNLYGTSRDKQFSQELQLSSSGSSKLTYTAGLFYFYADDRWQSLDVNFAPSPISPVPGSPVTIRADDRMRTDSIAGYAQATYELFRDTHLTLGGRYTYERKKLDGLSSFIVGGIDVHDTAIPDPALTIPNSISFKRFNYRVALDHRFGPDILGYISYNTGFKSGGYNLSVPSNAPYKPEDIKAAEVGLKTEFFDRKARLNTAAYYYSYKNIQVGRYIDNNQSIYNGAGARIYGADLDGEIIVAQGLTINGGFAYNHARFTSFPLADYIIPIDGLIPVPGGVVSASAKGNDLPFSPAVTVNIGGDYKITLPLGAVEANVTYFRASRFFGNADNVSSQPAYDLINMSISWTASNAHVSAKLWGKNIGNTYYATSLVEANQGIIRSNGAPRTYGVTVGYRF